ncbi:UDP-glucose 4-epimerase GalE [Halothiobacillus sp. DCM-1]|uniref:UDP-glucose 4-epimerase GalE n=1 Tax=Halothiobacillus sp. DCM-1 TaxID=3112558 RepID=UPI003246FF83
MADLLVVGGAGYIGSHMVKWLADAGHRVVVFDNLSTGHADAARFGALVVGDLANPDQLRALFAAHRFDAVLHLAAASLVTESVQNPAKYYRNNVSNTLNLLDAMREHGVMKLVFSSTAAIYGEPQTERIREDHPQRPINPYGRSKWMVEQILADYDTAYGIHSVCLRYFNAAGAEPDGLLGERHQPETHLIPLVLQAASGRRPHITVFGRDYDTPDGSCLRDYIHVQDLCSAHALALDFLTREQRSTAFNLGNGDGFSVLEVIEVARSVTGHEIPVMYAERRSGDPARLIADASRAHQLLGWQPRYPNLADLIAHAWQFEQQQAA